MKIQMHRGFYLGILLVLLACLMVTTAAWANEAEKGAELEVGYRTVDTDFFAHRAAEYTRAQSSMSLTGELADSIGQQHFNLSGHFTNSDDYLLEAHLDRNAKIRLNLRWERLFHNLDHLPYNLPTAVYNSVDGVQVAYEDLDPGTNYGISVTTTEAKLRANLGNYPAHVNLEYWRFEKEGDKQLRFVDESGSPDAFSCTATCHAKSTARDVNLVTEEVKAGFDAHLGLVDLIYSFIGREFEDKDGPPRDDFDHFAFGRRMAGNYEHDEYPDSQFWAHTLELHSSLSGGLTGAATGTIGKRKNQSEVTGVTPVEAESDFYKLAGDLSWTPTPKFTLNLRYRMYDLDQKNSSSFSRVEGLYAPFTGGTVPFASPAIRENPDITRGSYEAIVTWRPVRRWSLKGQYQHIDIHRSNTGGDVAFSSGMFGAFVVDPYWNLPEEESIDKYRLTLNGRMGSKSPLKLLAWHEFQTSSDPAYGTSFETAHRSFANINYMPSARWGINLGANIQRQVNQDNEKVGFDTDREQRLSHYNAGVWLVPLGNLSLGVNYAHMRMHAEQDMIFGTSPGYYIQVDKADYEQRTDTTSVTLRVPLGEAIQLQGEGYYTHSVGQFEPEFASQTFSYHGAFNALAVDDFITEQSEYNFVQSGARVGLEWQLQDNLRLSCQYGLADYEDKIGGSFQGTVSTYWGALSKAW